MSAKIIPLFKREDFRACQCCGGKVLVRLTASFAFCFGCEDIVPIEIVKAA